MARRSGYLTREMINEDLSLIEGSDTDYITPLGNVYKLTYNGLFLKKNIKPNIRNGYVYVGITMSDGKNKSTRVHRLVAKAFIPNPNGLEIVGHKNNIKHDNRVENLYWTTISENTQKAFDDELVKNAKGYEDSQSNPVNVYNNKGELIAKYGSISECSKALGVSKNTISRWCKGAVSSKKPRKGYTFSYQKP